MVYGSSMSYSIDLREHVITLSEDGSSKIAARRLFQVSCRTVQKKKERQDLKMKVPPRKSDNDKIDETALIAYVKQILIMR